MTKSEVPPLDDALQADLTALEALVVGNDELRQLEQLLAGFNLFETLGNVRREERHSDFLAFLLGPAQPHGFEEGFLRGFVQAALSAEPETPSTIRRIDAALFDLSEARVEREWNNIDVMVTCASERFVLLIENKIDTGEHSDQLRRYLEVVRGRFPGWSILPVFLTREGQPASHSNYHPVSYSDVHSVLNGLWGKLGNSLPPDVEVAVRHYLQMLERHIMDDTPIAVLARKIYARHTRALDIIFEHRPDAQEAIRRELVSLIEATEGTRLVYASKAYIQFVPVAWDSVETLREGSDGSWVKSPEILRFEFKQQGGLSLHLMVGPGEDSLRSRLHEISGRSEHKALFKHRSKTLGRVWTQFWRLAVYSKGDEADLSTEEKIEKVRQAWKTFVNGQLPVLTAVFVEEFIGPRTP